MSFTQITGKNSWLQRQQQLHMELQRHSARQFRVADGDASELHKQNAVAIRCVGIVDSQKTIRTFRSPVPKDHTCEAPTLMRSTLGFTHGLNRPTIGTAIEARQRGEGRHRATAGPGTSPLRAWGEPAHRQAEGLGARSPPSIPP